MRKREREGSSGREGGREGGRKGGGPGPWPRMGARERGGQRALAGAGPCGPGAAHRRRCRRSRRPLRSRRGPATALVNRYATLDQARNTTAATWGHGVVPGTRSYSQPGQVAIRSRVEQCLTVSAHLEAGLAEVVGLVPARRPEGPNKVPAAREHLHPICRRSASQSQAHSSDSTQ
jgi:hypothetical protein